ncbi:hypothetical protein HS088_TW02G00515 [Tripterygium wilfordii]|uniref:Uncharacterized protein n=1 Tax=Tripterygium wilfordii TaxID=458696 RepID=A0A7J7DZ22_TRIWF|nr:hypothetical protein HS088_TW02G00515 [Tripterygium wilfordii]
MLRRKIDYFADTRGGKGGRGKERRDRRWGRRYLFLGCGCGTRRGPERLHYRRGKGPQVTWTRSRPSLRMTWTKSKAESARAERRISNDVPDLEVDAWRS